MSEYRCDEIDICSFCNQMKIMRAVVAKVWCIVCGIFILVFSLRRRDGDGFSFWTSRFSVTFRLECFSV